MEVKGIEGVPYTPIVQVSWIDIGHPYRGSQNEEEIASIYMTVYIKSKHKHYTSALDMDGSVYHTLVGSVT